MHSQFIPYAVACTCAALVVSALLSTADSHDDAHKHDIQTEEVFQSAARLELRRQHVCEQLHAVLMDDEQGPEVRIRAGQLLGRLEYGPALPTLVRNIELQPSFDGRRVPPLAEALAQYGDGAVPAIVDACLKEDLFVIRGGVLRGRSISPMLHAIREAKSFRTAHVYANGLAAAHPDDRELAEKVTTFVRTLKRFEEE